MITLFGVYRAMPMMSALQLVMIVFTALTKGDVYRAEMFALAVIMYFCAIDAGNVAETLMAPIAAFLLSVCFALGGIFLGFFPAESAHTHIIVATLLVNFAFWMILGTLVFHDEQNLMTSKETSLTWADVRAIIAITAPLISLAKLLAHNFGIAKEGRFHI